MGLYSDFNDYLPNEIFPKGHFSGFVDFWKFFIRFWVLFLFFIENYAGVMGCGAAEATGLGFAFFVVINPCVLSANRVDLGFCFCFTNLQILPPTHTIVSRAWYQSRFAHQAARTFSPTPPTVESATTAVRMAKPASMAHGATGYLV